MTILIPLLVVATLYVVLTLSLLRAGLWLGSRIAVVFVGAVSTGYMVYSAVTTFVQCSAEPEYIPPTCAEGCGEGKLVFACDGPVGALAYGYSFLIAPVVTILIAALTFSTLRSLMRHRLGA